MRPAALHARPLRQLPPGEVDWFERAMRRGRVQTAAGALRALVPARAASLPPTSRRLRAAGDDPRELAAAVAGSRRRWRLEPEPGPRPRDGRAAPAPSWRRGPPAAIATRALRSSGARGSWRPSRGRWPGRWRRSRFARLERPGEGRVRIADPDRLRAARFDHVFVASLQDGEFPRRDRGGDPFLSEEPARALGLDPRRDTDAEERYLFHACLALPRKQPLPLLPRQRRERRRRAALAAARRRPPPARPAAAGRRASPTRSRSDLTRGRDLAQVVHPLAEAPSRGRAGPVDRRASGTDADPEALLAIAGAGGATRRADRRAAEPRRRGRGAPTRAPGPLINPAVIESLAAVPAYGGTTLEGFDVCSYRWFVGARARPRSALDPAPTRSCRAG